jgi:hypothetical protein
MEQCIFCQSVYELEGSDSTTPTALCSKKCEQGFKGHQKAIEDWFSVKPRPNCELCEGTGILAIDEGTDYVHSANMECDCVKEQEEK